MANFGSSNVIRVNKHQVEQKCEEFAMIVSEFRRSIDELDENVNNLCGCAYGSAIESFQENYARNRDTIAEYGQDLIKSIQYLEEMAEAAKSIDVTHSF